MTIYPHTMTISKSDFDTDAEYKEAYRNAIAHYDCKVKVDDGSGGIAWKFFETSEDMRIWKQQQ